MTTSALDTLAIVAVADYLKTRAPVPCDDIPADAALTEVVGEFKSRGLPEDVAADLIWDHYAPRCPKQWTPETLSSFVSDAYGHQNPREKPAPSGEPEDTATLWADEWAGPFMDNARHAELYRYARQVADKLPLNVRKAIDAADYFNHVNCSPALSLDEVADAVDRAVRDAATGAAKRPPPRPRTPPPAQERPLIVQEPQRLPENVTQAERALLNSAAIGPILAHADAYAIVRPARPVSAQEKARGGGGGGARIQHLGIATLREYLAKAATIHSIASNGKRIEAHASPELLAALIARNGGDAPALTGLISAPTIDRDGRVIDATGHDEATGLYATFPDGAFPALKSYRIVPAAPIGENGPSDLERALNAQFHTDNYVTAKRDARAAYKALIADALQGFCFRDRVDESAAVAALITGLVKPTIGPTPAFAICSPAQSTGKTTLAAVVGNVVEGAAPGMTDWADSDAENEKALLAMVIAGQSVGVLDNIPDGRELSSSKLARYITAEVVQGRILGESRMVRAPNVMLLMVTGNNLTCVGDLATRMVEIYLDSGLERPDQRAFQRDPIAWTQEHRPDIVRDALTITKAYLDAGAPAVDAKPTRFPLWDRMVRNPIIWAGGANIAAKFDAAYAADMTLASLREMLTGWAAVLGDKPVTAGTIVDKVALTNNGAGVEAFRQALHHLVGDKRSTVLDPRTVGTRLRRYVGRPIDDLRLASHYDTHRKVNLLVVESVPMAEVLS